MRKALPAKHMELVAMLKNEHGIGPWACQCSGGACAGGQAARRAPTVTIIQRLPVPSRMRAGEKPRPVRWSIT